MPRKVVRSRTNSKRTDTLEQRLAHHSAPADERGCILWTGAKANFGYGVTYWRGKMYRAHRIVWDSINGPIPFGLYVCHKCDRPACINPDHLFLGTQSDNLKDMSLKGRGRKTGSKGEEHGRALLTEANVIEIFTSQTNGISLAERFDVSSGTIYMIRNKRNWRHVTDAIDVRPWTKRNRPEPVEQR